MPRYLTAPRLVTALVSALAVALLTLFSGWKPASADTYIVQQGDTLSGIASCLEVSESVLLALNAGITSPDNIFAEQTIRIPANARGDGCDSEHSQPSSTRPFSQADQVNGRCTYIVEAGDFLGEIAGTFDSDLTTILSLNPIENPNVLQVGAELQIPCAAGAAADSPKSTSVSDRSGVMAGVVSEALPNTPRQTKEYVVQPGDGLQAIADRHNISLDELLSYNNLSRGAIIHPNDVLVIPVPDHLVPALDPAETADALTMRYTVRPGDMASSIARRHGILLDQLVRLNGGANLNLIQPGQTLVVPWTGEVLIAPLGTTPAVEVRRRTYRVQEGDTFSSIARGHGLTLEELRALNDPLPRLLVFTGQLLHLPGAIDPPVVSKELTLWEADIVQYAAATLGVTPHTLLANHGWLEPDQWLEAGSSWRLPIREGLLVTVQPGDTLRAIASRHGVNMDDILADPANGVDDPNAIVIGQEIILPLSIPDFIWPAQGELTDPFGLCRSWDCSYRHKGLDMALDFYEPIIAAADGVVTFVGGDPLFGLGWHVEIDHGGGWNTVYGHLVEFAAQQGQTVSRGDVIGYNGSTGHSTGPHLHFEVRHNDWYVDPMIVLP